MDGESSDAIGKANAHDIAAGIQFSKLRVPIILSMILVSVQTIHVFVDMFYVFMKVQFLKIDIQKFL